MTLTQQSSITSLHPTLAPQDVRVTVRGRLPERIRSYAQTRLAHKINRHDGRISATHVVITANADPSMKKPCTVEVGADINGQSIRAQVAAGAPTEAVDLAVDRLERRVATAVARSGRRRYHTPRATSAEWRVEPANRPAYQARPVEERRLLRRKGFVLIPQSVQQAIDDMELLGHSFYLFTDCSTGRDAIVYRREDSRYAVMGTVVPPEASPPGEGVVIGPDAPLFTENQARVRLDLSDEPFVFYRDPVTRQGRLMYRRFDGHYGLITPTSLPLR
jgi:ribosome-associated translation inhibitor RaiA